MRKKHSDEITTLTDAKLTLLRDGVLRLYRAEKLGSSVLAAVPASPEPEGALAQLRYEYNIRNELKHGFALRPLRFIAYNDGPAMLLEDPQGQILSELCKRPMQFHAFLRHATVLASTLIAAHACGRVHGALTPGNILLHPSRQRAWLTGFRPVSQELRAPSPGDGAASYVDPEVLHFIAPEATGRINRRIDARADLYSLGCIFYLLLTGNVPFPGLTPLEETYAHIARRPADPAPPSGVLPERVVAILFRLMAKEPEERYQSASEVLTDIQACVAKTTFNSRPERHARAVPALTTPQMLLQRDGELEGLRQAVNEASAGESTRMILLEGAAGIGKTALIHHFRKQLNNVSHVFAIGKCEQAEGATPYASLTRALRYVQREILGYSRDEFKRIQTQIKDALGGDASIVTAVFPLLGPILGVTEHSPAVSIHAEKPRFLQAVSTLLGAIAARGRPLILFLDDLQWVDEGTLEVLAYALRHPSSRCVLFVGAVRSNEAHPERIPIDLFPDDDSVVRFHLAPLSLGDVETLLEKLLTENIDRSNQLARLVHMHTGGNPLFAIQFVRSLVDDEMLRYDESVCEWRPNLPEIAERKLAPSVVELLAGKIDLLSFDTRAVLNCMALLAEPAALETLGAAMRLTEEEIKNRLRDGRTLQFVYLDDGRYVFAHDRVRDAVYQRMSQRQRIEGHLEIGRNLLVEQEQKIQTSIFVIAHQINMALPMVVALGERRAFASVNLEAARLAKEATAYGSAMSYLACASRFIRGIAHDESVYALVELRLGECEFLSIKMNRAQNRLKHVRADLLCDKHKADLARLRVALYVALDQPKLALEVGLRYLAEHTDIRVPLAPTDEQVRAEYESFMTAWSDQSIEDLIAAPLMRDERIQYAMDVLADIKPAALFISANLKDVVILRMASISLKFGHCDASCYAYVCLSLVSGARYGDYRTVSLFGELAMRLPQERGLSRFQGRVQMCYGALSLPWTGSAVLARQHIRESIRLTAQQGDMTFSVYSRRHLATNLIFSGVPLSDAQAVVEDGLALARKANFALVIDAFVAQACLIQSLRGGPVDIGLSGRDIDYLALLRDSLSGTRYRDIAAFSFWTGQLQVAYLFRDFAGALAAEEHADKLAWSSRSFLDIAEFTLYSALLRVELGRRSTGQEREVHLGMVQGRLSTFEKWSNLCPANFRYREKLILAELSHMQGQLLDAQSLYEEAIRLSIESGALHIQALSCELAARFCAGQQWHTAEQAYMKQAWNAYACWGADAKLGRLQQEFPYARPTPGSGQYSAHSGGEYQFDAHVMLRAAQALSSEMSLVKLIRVLVDNAVQYAGANRAVLCLLADGILNVAAEARCSQSTVEVTMERRVASEDFLPLSLAYSTVRTRESIVLQDAREDSHYGRDTYILAHESRSIMCVPLIKQGVLTGLLYLENSLMTGIFTRDRLQLLEVLASQAAISLENAKLYENLEAENHMRAVTERNLRETQARLDKVAKLTTMGELVASIVHEVSQPLSAVGTSARAALRWLNREVPDLKEARAMLNQISADSVRASDIVTGLRSMAKKSAPRLDDMDIHEAIREVLRLIREQLRSADVQVGGNFGTGNLHVRGDRILLQQVIMNLVVNAREAMNDIVGRAKVIEVATRVDDNHVLWVSVTDSGPGISDQVAATLFDSFTTTKESGMGMGLSICKSIIEAHGGCIEAERGGEWGACFRFSVPQPREGDITSDHRMAEGPFHRVRIATEVRSRSSRFRPV